MGYTCVTCRCCNRTQYIEDDRSQIFCTYCGNPWSGVSESPLPEQDSGFHQQYTDSARMMELRLEEARRIREEDFLASEEAAARTRLQRWVRELAVGVGITALFATVFYITKRTYFLVATLFAVTLLSMYLTFVLPLFFYNQLFHSPGSTPKLTPMGERVAVAFTIGLGTLLLAAMAAYLLGSPFVG